MRTPRLIPDLSLSFLLLLGAIATPAAEVRTQQPTVRPAPPTLLASFDVSAGTRTLGDTAARVFVAIGFAYRHH